MEKLLDYSFIPVPRIYQFLDDKCFRFIVFLIDRERFYKATNKLDSKGYFFISNETISNVLGYSTKTINNIVETLYRSKIINVISEGKQGKMITNRYYVNYDVLINLNCKIERVDRTETKSYRGQNSTGKINFGQNSTDRDSTSETYFGQNSTDNFGQNSTVYKSISSKSIKNNIYGPNIYSYIEGKKDFSSKSEGKINCFLSDSEIEGYINSSEAFNESETGKEELKENNINNSNEIISNTANAVTERSKELDNSNNVIPNYKLDNSNEVNTAVLSPSNSTFEELVISTEKMSENSLKQAKTRELEIINKTDNSNSVEYSTANAVTEEVEESKEVNNSINVNSNNNSVYSNLKNNNTANAVTEKVEIINSFKPVIEEGIEGENKTDNSNLNINNTIAEGDNPTANAVQEFRDKCTNYTIIIEGKETEIDQPIEEYIRCYYNRIMNTIYNTNDLNKKRKIFNKILNENKLFGEQYDEMSDNLDIRYSRYLELDKQQANKQTEKEEFSQEEIKYIANELLSQCLDFTLTKDNRMQDFYDLRNNYNAFIEQYNIKKEGLKLQKKFAELSNINKKLNTPVSSQSFAV